MPKLTDLEWAWVAGLFEGEGTIVFTARTSVMVAVQMVDRDVLETLNLLIPAVSGVNLARRGKPGYADQFSWVLCSKASVQPFLEAILPWMHSRRAARIAEALERLGNNRGGATHCPHGHPYNGPNLYLTPAGHRQCRACRKTRS